MEGIDTLVCLCDYLEACLYVMETIFPLPCSCPTMMATVSRTVVSLVLSRQESYLHKSQYRTLGLFEDTLELCDYLAFLTERVRRGSIGQEPLPAKAEPVQDYQQ